MKTHWMLLFFLIGLLLGGTGCIGMLMDFIAGPVGEGGSKAAQGAGTALISAGEVIGGTALLIAGTITARLGYMWRQKKKRDGAKNGKAEDERGTGS